MDVAVILERRDRPVDRRIRDEALAAQLGSGCEIINTHILSLEAFRYYQATNSLYYRSMRDDGVPLWPKQGVNLWDESGVTRIGRERDVTWELQKASNDLRLAKAALAAGDPANAAGRAYYAAFHPVRTALLTVD